MGVQCFAHLLELPLQVIYELLAVLILPVANGESSGDLRGQVNGVLRHSLAFTHPFASLLLLFLPDEVVSLFPLRQGASSYVIQRAFQRGLSPLVSFRFFASLQWKCTLKISTSQLKVALLSK
jgi:hypothetical protein